MNARAGYGLPPNISDNSRQLFEEFRRVFPKRAMKVSNPGATSVTLLLILSILFAGLGVFFLVNYLPDIADDFQISMHAVPVPDADTSGSCKTRRFVFVECTLKTKYRPDPDSQESVTTEEEISFLGSAPTEISGAVRHSGNPAMVTSALAIDKLANRLLTTLVMGVLLIGLAVATIRRAWKYFRVGRAIKGKVSLSPVLVTIKEIDKHNSATYHFFKDGKKHTGEFRFVKSEPCYLPGESAAALAVALPGIDYCFLLDAEMAIIDLTEMERAALRAAIAA